MFDIENNEIEGRGEERLNFGWDFIGSYEFFRFVKYVYLEELFGS